MLVALMTFVPLRSLRPLGSIKRAALLAVLDALRIENAAQDVVAYARQILHAAAPDHDDRVLLKVVAFARNIANDLMAVGQANLGDLAKRRVRLLRSRRVDARAYAPLLGTSFKRRNFVSAFLS